MNGKTYQIDTYDWSGLDRRITRFLIVTSLFVCVSACAVGKRAENLDPLPPWNYQELVESATRGWGFQPEDIKEAHLLAWHSELDSRYPAHQVDNALFWVHAYVADPKRLNYLRTPQIWLILSISREPEKSDKWWENARLGSHGAPGFVYFEQPPKNQDIYKFLGDKWEFSSTDRFQLLEGAVRRNTWREVVGQEPTKFHSNEKRTD